MFAASHPRKGPNVNRLRPILISVAQYQHELSAGVVDVLDVIEAARRFGVDGVELRPEAWRDRERELPAALDRLAEFGLLVSYATMQTLFPTNRADAQPLDEDIEVARQLGSRQLRVFPGPVPGDDDRRGWEIGTAAVEDAASRGITIAIENYSGTPGGRISEIERLLDRIPSPALATNIDIGNYARNGEDVPTAIRAVGSRAVSAHLKDQGGTADDRPTYLGGGSLPLPAILDELDRLPQPVLYCFEFPGGGDPERRIEESLAYLRKRGLTRSDSSLIEA